jgi:glutamine amidotransferase
VGVVNYGAGNILSIANALSLLGAVVHEVSAPEEIRQAEALVLPGVGAFPAAARRLSDSGLADALLDHALHRGRPLLGICLGMQLLTECSEEFGTTRGLGIIAGKTCRIPVRLCSLPHVGWNEVLPQGDDGMYAGIPQHAHFYFDHSYAVFCPEPFITGVARYEEQVVASVRQGTVWGTQFHPEKSQVWGLRLLRNFLDMTAGGRDDA